MSLSYYRSYFNSNEEYERFKTSSPSLIDQANGLYKSLMANGYNEERAKWVVAESLHSSFSMFYNIFIQNKG